MNRRLPLIAAALAAALVAGGCATNPVTGKSDIVMMSAAQEVEIGRQMHPKVLQEYGRYADEELQAYVSDLGQRIAAVSHRPELQYTFTVLDSEEVNAFALPGGYVYITRDLLKEFKTEAQLAAVLSHEIGHVVARDTLVAMSEQIGMTAIMVAAQAGGSPDLARGTRFVTAVLSLQYSREDEKEADLAGLTYMTQAGYDPNAMIEVMQILEKLQTIRPIEFFSTHPNPESRIAYLQERIARRFASLPKLKEGQEEYSQRVLSPLNERKKRFNVPSQESAGAE